MLKNSNQIESSLGERIFNHSDQTQQTMNGSTDMGKPVTSDGNENMHMNIEGSDNRFSPFDEPRK